MFFLFVGSFGETAMSHRMSWAALYVYYINKTISTYSSPLEILSYHKLCIQFIDKSQFEVGGETPTIDWFHTSH